PEKLAALAAGLPAAASLAAEGVRQARLDVCEKCDALRENVLCAYCGCFVLFRARPARSYCPHPAGDKWKTDLPLRRGAANHGQRGDNHISS
ncbi:MAG: DUF6171 family protein, partial [Treponema sp.]|nr:DUF6171 family protein [Treponema sp.]